MKRCPLCHKPLTDWIVFRHRFTNNVIKAKYTAQGVVTESGIKIASLLFSEWFEQVVAEC
jgi:hypothetical protein